MTDRPFRNVDWVLIATTVALVAYGFVALASAAYGGPEARYLLRTRVMHLVIGLAAMTAMALLDYRRVATLSPFIYIGSVLLLLSVFVIGESRLGAQRWIPLGPFGGFQPSEIAKLAAIVTLAWHLDRIKVLPRMRALIPFVLHIAVPMLLIVRQPDMGTALVLLAVLVAMLYVGGARIADLAGLGAIGAAAAPMFWQVLHDYQRRRLTAFLDPGADPLGAGYALIQSKIAIGSGQLLGKGLFAGTQNVLRFIPEQHTDFIFTAIGEELGLVGGVVLLGLYLLWAWRALGIAAGARDRLGALVATGIVAMMIFHVVVNIGMTVGLMPVTGIPLPLISYGGSSLLVTLAATGMLLSIRLRRGRGVGTWP